MFFPEGVHMYHGHVWYPQRSEEAVETPGTVVPDCCECARWMLGASARSTSSPNLGLLLWVPPSAFPPPEFMVLDPRETELSVLFCLRQTPGESLATVSLVHFFIFPELLEKIVFKMLVKIPYFI